jgi:hypothetical protein
MTVCGFSTVVQCTLFFAPLLAPPPSHALFSGAGEGTQLRFIHHGLTFEKIDKIFITHLHGVRSVLQATQRGGPVLTHKLLALIRTIATAYSGC